MMTGNQPDSMDYITEIGAGSIIQHGRYNARIYLMKLFFDDYPLIIKEMERIAVRENYGKIVAKIPSWAYDGFISSGYKKEAIIPRYFLDGTDLYFVSRFLDKSRSKDPRTEYCDDVIETSLAKDKNKKAACLGTKYHYKILEDNDADEIAAIYRQVFKTYPFPIFEKEYILKTMRDNLIYFGIFNGNMLVSVSSTEIDKENNSVEMTDFSTLPEYRGNGFAGYLLFNMENEMKKRNIRTFYTIARSMSYGMNITFAKNSYIYSGRLINNTNISGSIESMNIWYKVIV